MTTKARVFRNGRSQAVRLPKEFRFAVNEVKVTRVGNGILLQPIDEDKLNIDEWFARLDSIVADVSEDLIELPIDSLAQPEIIFDQ